MVATLSNAAFDEAPGDLSEEVLRLRFENAGLKEQERRQCRELAEVLRDLKALSYSVSHDLRAPLRAIDGFSQMLDEDFTDQLGDEGRRLIGVIRDSCRTMDQLTGALAEYLRACRAGEPLATTAVDMTSLASAAAREVSSLYQGRQPRIDIADLPEVDGEAGALRRVWCNLIGNALKYTAKEPDPRIAISGEVQGAEAVFQISDNGAGFDMRYADRLFGVFQRLHRPDEFDGTGVGLAIVQRIVLRHGGRVWAQGTPGAGACFRFALPLAQASETA